MSSATVQTAADIQLDFYEKFFIAKDLEPYPVQEQAMERIFAGESVLVTVPTGTGKTLMAKAAIHKALAAGQTAVYTTPLRALTEEKYRELCADFGEGVVGFATGDYKVNPEGPVQVVVAEILWNRIIGDRVHAPADVVVMDEGHYFNDLERGYVWEQSIIGLDPRSQLVILSATVGEADRFCQWVYLCRRVPMALVQSFDRRVPLYHEYREQYLIDVVKELHAAGDTPAIIFGFSRDQCFERARLIKSCPRFTSDEERARIEQLAGEVLLDRGIARDLKPLLLHGIGIHHAGILPRYKALVERLTLERLCKFVVSTETISAGINLPAKRVVFPELRKFIQGKPRLLLSAEYHQMAGRAGRPQFDKEGIALTLAPEEVVQEIRKEIKDGKKGGYTVDEAKIRKGAYSRAKAEATKAQDVTWDPDAHARLVAGQPAPLRSQTKVTAEQVLAIGLPDLTVATLPGAVSEGESTTSTRDDEGLPACMNLNIVTVIDHLLLPDKDRHLAQKRLAQVTANMKALGIIDEHGAQVSGQIVGKLRGIDGLFVYYALMNRDMQAEDCRALCEFLLDHDVIQRKLSREADEKKREWIKNRLRERRREEDGQQVSWEDVEAEYEATFPRELTPLEVLHNEFLGKVPHPELHGGKVAKTIWATMETEDLGFMDFIERNGLETEEGNLFSYLARVMKIAHMLHEATGMAEFGDIDQAVRRKLSAIDERVLDRAAGA
jgi:hypothetical protein